MSFLANVHVVCFLASYAVAFGLEWTRLARLNKLNRAIILVFAAAGFVAHTSYLMNRSGRMNLPPLLSSTHDWLLVLAWLGILLYLFVSCVDRNVPVGLFLLPVVLALIVSAHFVSVDTNPRIAADPGELKRVVRNWAMLHASLLVFGILGVLTGLVLSMMYLVQHRRLKHKQPGHEGLAFPNLERLAKWNRWAIIVSVPLLTLGMATGVGLALYSTDGGSTISLRDPVIILDGVVWLVMVGLFGWLLRTERPPAKQVAWFTLWACAFLLVTVLGLQVLVGGVHPAVESWHTRAGGAPGGRGARGQGGPRLTFTQGARRAQTASCHACGFAMPLDFPQRPPISSATQRPREPASDIGMSMEHNTRAARPNAQSFACAPLPPCPPAPLAHSPTPPLA